MRYFRRFLKWSGIILTITIVCAVIAIHTINFSVDEKTISSTLENIEYTPKFVSFVHKGRNMHYVSIGDTSKPAVLFVHGSPGSWDNFLGFMADTSLVNNFHLISVDRPGFGKSGYGIPERSLQQQASNIAAVLSKENKPAILVGHSYGGPVITRMAIDFPDITKGIILVAGSVDPGLEKTKWFQIPVHYKILSWVLPGQLYATNEEIIALKPELEAMIPLWKNITQPASVIQGGLDNLVPMANATFANTMLINAPTTMIEIPEMNHFVPWKNPILIKKEILRIQSYLDDNSCR